MSVGSKNSTGQSSFTKILGFLSFRRKTLGEKRFLLCGKSFVKCYKQETRAPNDGFFLNTLKTLFSLP